MAWERRTRGTRYYTRSKKIGGRVVREYVGCGPVGALAATLDAEERAEVQQKARAWIESCSRLEAAAAVTDQFSGAAEMLARGALLLAGFRQHHRGEWRRVHGRGADEIR